METPVNLFLDDGDIRECPVCFSREWEIDYLRTDDGEMRVDTCAVCGWPPPSLHGVKEYRDKWAVAGETSHSHPSPATLRHVAYLADRVEALVEVARAARDTGWRDADGLCWCDQSQELTGDPHRPQCERMRAALARLDKGAA